MPRGAARGSREDGFSLIELVVALGIGAVVLAFIAAGMTGGLAGIAAGREGTEANALARGAIESARGLGWDGLAHDTADAALAADPDAAGGMYAGEPLVEEGGGALSPYVSYPAYAGVSFTVRTFVTTASFPSNQTVVKRLSVVVTWAQGARTRRATLSTLVNPIAVEPGAAAYVLDGELAGTPLGRVAYVEADVNGGSHSVTVASFSPVTGVSGSGGEASAWVTLPGPIEHGAAGFATLSIGLTGLSVSASGIVVTAERTGGATPVLDGSGTVLVNGTPFVDPGPGTTITLPGWRIVLNDQRTEPDGSASVTFIRITSTLNDDELTAAWAWVK